MITTIDASVTEKQKNFIPSLILVLFILVYSITAVTLALNLYKEIIPDEVAHALLIEEYEKTLGIPAETAETIRNGITIEGNPFLYYWLIARARNIVSFIRPNTTGDQLFYFSRILNTILSIGTLFVTWLITRKLIKNPWYQLLPTVFLGNLQMFFLLSTGINYDNLLNLLCALALYFLVDVINNKQFWPSSIRLSLVLGLAGLTKKTSIPFIGILLIIWLFLLIKNKPKVEKPKGWMRVLLFLAVLIIAGNAFMYSRNLFLYKTLIPGCHSLNKNLPCETSYFYQRWKQHNIPRKLTLGEAREMGLPNTLNYYIGHWSTKMLDRNVGILAHKSFSNPLYNTFAFALILLAIFGVTFVKKPQKDLKILSLIALLYTLVLYLYNYDEQLYYAFAGYAIQGRYIFPVIIIYLTLISYILSSIRPKLFKIMATIGIVLLSIVGGPIQFLFFYRSVFVFWF